MSLPGGGSLLQSPSPWQQEVLECLMGLVCAMGDRQGHSGGAERGPGGDLGWINGWMDGAHVPLLSRPASREVPAEVLVGLT